MTSGNWAEQLCTARAEVAQDFNLLHLELEGGQFSMRLKSVVVVKLTHRYIAGVVYRNDSDIGASVAGPLALTQVVPSANRSTENVTRRPIV